MSAVGIICEYNPFHEGHQYQIQKAREISGADTVVAIMNGNFVQRGEPAVTDKYTRARMALAEGADLVFELPVRYGLSSAEDFARGGVLALQALPFVKYICFGSECGDGDRLLAAGNFFAMESTEYQEKLGALLRGGMAYPAAREQAYIQCTGEQKTEELFAPNSTLGIAYLKAIKQLGSGLKPILVERQGMGYHDIEEQSEEQSGGEGRFLSATAIREGVRQGRFEGMPPGARNIFMESPWFPDAEDFWQMCSYGIRSRWERLEQIKDMSVELASVFRKNWYEAVSFYDFVNGCKTKNQTMARVKRCVFQTLLGMEKDAQPEGELPYLRLLGMRNGAKDCLEQMNNNTVLLGRLARDMKRLDAAGMAKLQMDLLAADMYGSVVAAKSGRTQRNEYQRPVIRTE